MWSEKNLKEEEGGQRVSVSNARWKELGFPLLWAMQYHQPLEAGRQGNKFICSASRMQHPGNTLILTSVTLSDFWSTEL